MKNRIKQILFVAVSAVMTMSCSLKEDTSSLYTPENYFASKAECQSAVNSCYIPLKPYTTIHIFWQPSVALT